MTAARNHRLLHTLLHKTHFKHVPLAVVLQSDIVHSEQDVYCFEIQPTILLTTQFILSPIQPRYARANRL